MEDTSCSGSVDFGHDIAECCFDIVGIFALECVFKFACEGADAIVSSFIELGSFFGLANSFFRLFMVSHVGFSFVFWCLMVVFRGFLLDCQIFFCGLKLLSYFVVIAVWITLCPKVFNLYNK